MIRLVHGAATHLGLVRRQNEDSFVVTDGLYAVCDGMGGARAGEVASEAACRILLELPTEADADDLRGAVVEANTVVRERSLADSELAGMGTTLTAASARGSNLTLAQVGDSRAYLWRLGDLRQVTEDHSLVAEMIKRGQLTEEQAAVHPHRSIITRAIGTEPSVNPDIFDLPLEAGDRVVLCSDGLSGMVPEKELARIVGTGDDPQRVADALVAAALHYGGEDNVTAVVIFALGDDPPSDEGDPEVSDQEVPLSPGMRASDASVDPAAPGPPSVDADGLGPLVRASDGVAASGWRSRRGLLIGVVVALVVIAVVIGGFLIFNSSVYFVGTTDGQVALFRGMPYAVVGIDLYSVFEIAPARFESLETYQQNRVDAHEIVTKEEGLLFIRGLEASQ